MQENKKNHCCVRCTGFYVAAGLHVFIACQKLATCLAHMGRIRHGLTGCFFFNRRRVLSPNVFQCTVIIFFAQWFSNSILLLSFGIKGRRPSVKVGSTLFAESLFPELNSIWLSHWTLPNLGHSFLFLCFSWTEIQTFHNLLVKEDNAFPQC